MPAAAPVAARRRPQARRTASRPPIHWHRVGRLALLVTFAAIVLLYIPPVTHWIEQRRTASHAKVEMQGLQRENEVLRGRMRQLTGPDALEREARRLGMVRRGERPYVVEPAP
jgi:cell division protein FtsB